MATAQTGELLARNLGLIPYLEARAIQEQLVSERLRGKLPDTVLYCEHPPVITTGRRTRAEHLSEFEKIKQSGLAKTVSDVPIIEVSRGGSVTVHLPGQLVIYPVISLPGRRIGVRAFVECGLECVAEALRRNELLAEIRLNPAGVWSVQSEPKKIAQVGIQMIRGVTNHGFSVNLSCSLDLFRMLSPCGLSPDSVGNVAELYRDKQVERNVSIAEFIPAFHSLLESRLAE